MKQLEAWMAEHGVDDGALAAQTDVSRVQISRIRRNLSRASPEVAAKLEAITGIPAWDFVKPVSAAA
jgi:transcriptional regulator with XRE-family HTH domain